MTEFGGEPSDKAVPQISYTEVRSAAASRQLVRSTRRPPKGGGGPDHAMTIGFLLIALRRWWKVATPLAVLLAGTVGAAVYLLCCEPEYEAKAWFRIEDKAPYVAFQSRSDERSKAFFETQVELIRSPLVLGRAIEPPEIGNLPSLARQHDKIGWLSKQLRVTPVGDSELFTLCYSDHDPDNAAALVNAVAEAYFSLRDESETQRRQRVLELLEQEQERRSRAVLRLREELRSLADRVKEGNLVAGKLDAASLLNRPSGDLQGQLIAVQVDGAVLEAKIAAIEEGLGSPAGDGATQQGRPAADRRPGLSALDASLRDAIADRQIAESPEVKQQAALILAKQVKLHEIERVATAGKQDAIYAQFLAEIAEDERALDKLRQELHPFFEKQAASDLLAKRTESESALAAKRFDDLEGLKSELKGRRLLEARIREEYDKSVRDGKQANGGVLELEFKRDELGQAEKVCELMSQRVLELQTESEAPSRVYLLHRADPPTAPLSAPHRILLLAVLASFCAPFVAAVAWERALRRVGGPQDLQQQSSLDVVGEIPRLPARSARRLALGSAGVTRCLFEESIDSLRTMLMLSEDLRDMRFLAITSAASSEGKTSVAARLAVSLGRAVGEPILLIDGDMRSPNIHNLFEVALAPGLAQVLGNECSLTDAIVAGAGNHVDVLPAGELAAPPHALLRNEAWEALLATIPDKYRYVIIDTPPVLAAAEALILARGADASLVCAMRDVSRVEHVKKACERLLAAGGRPVGIVLNGVPANRYVFHYYNRTVRADADGHTCRTT